MSAVRLAVPMLLGIEQHLRTASRGGRSSSQLRCARGQLMIANPDAVASPALNGATGGACRLRDASQLAIRVAHLPYKSLPLDLRQTAVRPWSGWEAVRSDLHGQGIGEAQSPTRDQRHSWYQGEQPQASH